MREPRGPLALVSEFLLLDVMGVSLVPLLCVGCLRFLLYFIGMVTNVREMDNLCVCSRESCLREREERRRRTDLGDACYPSRLLGFGECFVA